MPSSLLEGSLHRVRPELPMAGRLQSTGSADTQKLTPFEKALQFIGKWAGRVIMLSTLCVLPLLSAKLPFARPLAGLCLAALGVYCVFVLMLVLAKRLGFINATVLEDKGAKPPESGLAFARNPLSQRPAVCMAEEDMEAAEIEPSLRSDTPAHDLQARGMHKVTAKNGVVVTYWIDDGQSKSTQ